MMMMYLSDVQFESVNVRALVTARHPRQHRKSCVELLRQFLDRVPPRRPAKHRATARRRRQRRASTNRSGNVRSRATSDGDRTIGGRHGATAGGATGNVLEMRVGMRHRRSPDAIKTAKKTAGVTSQARRRRSSGFSLQTTARKLAAGTRRLVRSRHGQRRPEELGRRQSTDAHKINNQWRCHVTMSEICTELVNALASNSGRLCSQLIAGARSPPVNDQRSSILSASSPEQRRKSCSSQVPRRSR